MNGWVPILMQDTFQFSKSYWTDENEYNPSGGETGFDQQETKLPTYWNTSFSKICLGMMSDKKLRFIVINKQADSLYSLIADGKYRNTSLGRDTWKKLLGDHASLQRNCNMEGFNAVCHNRKTSARIGIVTNNEDDCHSCDSGLGFGAKGKIYNTCGNVAERQADNGDKDIKAMGYVLVQWMEFGSVIRFKFALQRCCGYKDILLSLEPHFHWKKLRGREPWKTTFFIVLRCHQLVFSMP